MKKFARILIANRGEIAARIARTVRRLGLVPIVVYSDADRETLAVREILIGASGEAHRLGPAPSSESYLMTERILEVARRAKADAVHPGYGFLSEDSSFARSVLRSGLMWIGPTPEAMDRVSSKSRAKTLAESVGVPTLAGHRENQDVESFAKAASSIGYPVLLKAAAGGGGRGIRKVTSVEDLRAQFDVARSEAERAFGDGELLLEKYVERAHHVEVQIFGDVHGTVVALGDRDCSTQRRHQKIIEETPSAAMDADTRERILRAAVDIGKAAKYTNAGTVEFLVEGSNFHFLEVNTRLQVEHPVTEAVTGLDLVEWQIRVAQGEALPHGPFSPKGHAIELRLCAEDPRDGFKPSTGAIEAFEFPEDVRVDHFLVSGAGISRFYDSMIAKIIVSGANRTEAIAKGIDALDRTFVSGVVTNRTYLREILLDEKFRSATLTTRDLDEDRLSPPRFETARAEAVGVLALASMIPGGDWPEPFRSWSNSGPRRSAITLRETSGAISRWTLEESGDSTTLRCGDQLVLTAKRTRRQSNGLSFEDDSARSLDAFVRVDGGRAHVLFEGVETTVVDAREKTSAFSTASANPDLVSAPMDGLVTKVLARTGADVRGGETLAVIEAMKMQIELKSPRDGRIENVLVEPGHQVRNRQPLVKLELSKRG